MKRLPGSSPASELARVLVGMSTSREPLRAKGHVADGDGPRVVPAACKRNMLRLAELLRVMVLDKVAAVEVLLGRRMKSHDLGVASALEARDVLVLGAAACPTEM
mmetsp:Transcript_46680/g.111015  ORF Transcript_46680/g.111015 Transcript_46680/m.111015 type:complete len:105 (-) Transcript_46680:1339-1653(-)